MKQNECQKLIDSYLQWLKEGIEIQELDSCCEIKTPFLDRHNDAITLYIEKQSDVILLTDDGYTISDLRASGLEFTTPKRRGHLDSILNGFGVKLKNEEISVIVPAVQDFPQKKHNLIQSMLAISDMFVMGTEHVISLFKEDVALFLQNNNIAYLHDFKLSGKSGLDHKFDFGLPKTRNKPERVLQVINRLGRQEATSLAFGINDVRTVRPDDNKLEALSFLNDVVYKPSEDNLAVLRAYNIKPLLWSKRDLLVNDLNGG